LNLAGPRIAVLSDMPVEADGCEVAIRIQSAQLEKIPGKNGGLA